MKPSSRGVQCYSRDCGEDECNCHGDPNFLAAIKWVFILHEVNARQTSAVGSPTSRKHERNPLAPLIEQQQDTARCKQICQKITPSPTSFTRSNYMCQAESAFTKNSRKIASNLSFTLLFLILTFEEVVGFTKFAETACGARVRAPRANPCLHLPWRAIRREPNP